MFWAKKAKKDVSKSMAKFSGRTDFLEAVCASCALVATADGSVSSDEKKNAIKVVSTNPQLAAAFKTQEIEKTLDTMLTRAEAGRTGRMGLYKEIDQISVDDEMKETVYLTALDIAETDKNVGDQEREVLTQLAKRLGLNPDNYASV